MKVVLGFLMLAVFANTALGFCILGKGKDCPDKGEANSPTIIFANSPPSSQQSNDGGYLSKLQKGDKSQEQGYAEYKEHFLYYAYQVYSSPGETDFKKSRLILLI